MSFVVPNLWLLVMRSLALPMAQEPAHTYNLVVRPGALLSNG